MTYRTYIPWPPCVCLRFVESAVGACAGIASSAKVAVVTNTLVYFRVSGALSTDSGADFQVHTCYSTVHTYIKQGLSTGSRQNTR
jgi:hypothetical protein